MVVLSEIFLYLCFSVVMGTFLLGVIPEDKRPSIAVPKPLLISSIIGIPVLSFFPVLQVVLYLYEDFGLSQTIRSVVFTLILDRRGWSPSGCRFCCWSPPYCLYLIE